MSNYEKMYKEIFNAVEQAINILINTQQKCEEIYISEISITEELDKRKEEETLSIL